MIATPEAPRVVPDPTFRPSGVVTQAPTLAALQSAITAAAKGDRITVDPSAPWVGNLQVVRQPEQGRIMVTSTRDDVPVRFVTPNIDPAIRVARRNGGVQFHNVEVTLLPTVAARVYSLVEFGSHVEKFEDDGYPRDLGFSGTLTRIFGSPTQELIRGILANCGMFFFVDGRVEEAHGNGADAQAIECFNAAPGHLLRDCWLEGAGENVMFGGVGSNGPNMNPRDITLERVTLFKPLRWKVGHPEHDGRVWTVKNHLEFKNAQRVRGRGLRMVNCWRAGQEGRSVVLTPRDVAGAVGGIVERPWIMVQDIDLQEVEIRDVNSAFVLLGHDDAAGGGQPEATATSRIRFRNWLITLNANGKNFETSADCYDVELDRITWAGPLQYADVIMGGTLKRAKLTNLIGAHGTYSWTGASGEGYAIRHLFLDEQVWGPNIALGTGWTESRPTALPGVLTGVPDRATVFTDPATGNYRVKAGSPWTGLGVDQDALEAALPPTDGGGAVRPNAPVVRLLSASPQEGQTMPWTVKVRAGVLDSQGNLIGQSDAMAHRLYRDGIKIQDLAKPATGPTEFTLTVPEPEITLRLGASALDAVGNESLITPLDVPLDATAPIPPIFKLVSATWVA